MVAAAGVDGSSIFHVSSFGENAPNAPQRGFFAPPRPAFGSGVVRGSRGETVGWDRIDHQEVCVLYCNGMGRKCHATSGPFSFGFPVLWSTLVPCDSKTAPPLI